jgi:hypothetical protein
MEIKLSAFLVKSFLLRGDDDFWKVLVVIASSESRLEFVTDRWCLGRTHNDGLASKTILPSPHDLLDPVANPGVVNIRYIVCLNA